MLKVLAFCAAAPLADRAWIVAEDGSAFVIRVPEGGGRPCWYRVDDGGDAALVSRAPVPGRWAAGTDGVVALYPGRLLVLGAAERAWLPLRWLGRLRSEEAGFCIELPDQTADQARGLPVCAAAPVRLTSPAASAVAASETTDIPQKIAPLPPDCCSQPASSAPASAPSP